ncbi:hypothetical protein C8R45DRAFT_1089448 [Mycena sanguinolenta]|nr:hypothetical protein C8R45DRAFT_1089448 [Mycena sanguinolenta]
MSGGVTTASDGAYTLLGLGLTLVPASWEFFAFINRKRGELDPNVNPRITLIVLEFNCAAALVLSWRDASDEGSECMINAMQCTPSDPTTSSDSSNSKLAQPPLSEFEQIQGPGPTRMGLPFHPRRRGALHNFSIIPPAPLHSLTPNGKDDSGDWSRMLILQLTLSVPP